MTLANVWEIYIPHEGVISIVPSEHIASVNPDASLSLEKPIVTVAWQGYLRAGQFIPAAEFVG